MRLRPTFFPPEPGLAQRRVGALPFPIDPTQLIASFDEGRPNPLHNPAGAPALEPVMDGALGAELAGELFPLATGAHPEEDPIEGGPPVGGPASGRLLGPELQEDREDPLPQGIWDLPDGSQRLRFRFASGL